MRLRAGNAVKTLFYFTASLYIPIGKERRREVQCYQGTRNEICAGRDIGGALRLAVVENATW
jgi:hypothetical protein